MNASKNKPVPKSTQPAVPPAQRKNVQNGTSETQKKTEGKKAVCKERILVNSECFILTDSSLLGGTSQEFNAVDILRHRLHQKIEESRGQVHAPVGLND